MCSLLLMMIIVVLVVLLELLLLLLLVDAAVDLVRDCLLVDALGGGYCVVVVVGQHEQEGKDINLLL